MATAAQAYRHLGIKKQSFYELVTARKITRKGRNGYDLAEVQREYEQNVLPRQGGPRKEGEPAPSSQGSTLAQATAAVKAYDAQIKRAKLMQMAGTLVSRERVMRLVPVFFRNFRDSWLSWPARTGARITADILHQLREGDTINERFIIILLEKYVHEQLTQLSEEEPPAL